MAPSPTQTGRILFASASHGGMFEAMTPIVAELADRGTEVWFGSTADRRAAAEKISERVQFVELGPHLPEYLPANWDDKMLRRLNSRSRVRGFAAFLDQGPPPERMFTNYDRALAAIDEIKPTLMVIDAATGWALDAALTRGIPYVMSSPMCVGYMYANLLSWRSNPWPYSALPAKMNLPQKVANLAFVIGQLATFMRPRFLARNMPAIRERRRRALPNPNALLWQYADGAKKVIGHSLFGIEHPLPSTPENLAMLGPMVPGTTSARADHSALFEWLDGGQPVVYIGLGTTSRPNAWQLEAIVDAARQIGPQHRVLWSVRAELRSLLPKDLPATLRIEEWVPQTEVLAHRNVHVFMSHGGNGGHHGLYFGKPLLCLPHTWEVRDGSVRFVSSGAALMIDDTRVLNATEIATKLHRLLTESRYRERAEYWADRFRQAGGVRRAVDLIVELSHGQLTPERT